MRLKKKNDMTLKLKKKLIKHKIKQRIDTKENEIKEKTERSDYTRLGVELHTSYSLKICFYIGLWSISHSTSS